MGLMHVLGWVVAVALICWATVTAFRLTLSSGALNRVIMW
jgi:hypothetical protein